MNEIGLMLGLYIMVRCVETLGAPLTRYASEQAGVWTMVFASVCFVAVAFFTVNISLRLLR